MVVAASTFYQNRHMTGAAADGLTQLTHANLTNTVNGIRTMVAAQNEILQEAVVSDLNVARRVKRDGGGLFLDFQATATWTAVNQYTQEKHAIDLPYMSLGGECLGQNADPGIPTALVDDVKLLVGGTCTVFQRMNAAGDMLRVATNVEKLDKPRAIGTYIPAVNPDGKPNPVVATLLNRKTFKGRAFVVNAWYLTAYEPLFNNDGDLIGALYFGVKQEATPAMREALIKIKIGRTGMWILASMIAVALVASLALWTLMAGRVGRRFSVFTSHMQGASDEVASAAAEVSGASQSLAEGASEQAASIEETSASLEEMAAMTRQNADNAGQADGLMKDANQTIATANTTMDRMTTSMSAITATGEETQKIVKTIDEIAFQTNLLT